MSDTGKIYIIKNTINNKVYIGKTIQKLQERWRNHLGDWSNCSKLKAAMKFLGKSNFYIEILEDNISYEILDLTEIKYIKLYDSINNGYNIKQGNSNFKGRSLHKIPDNIKHRVIEDYIKGVSPILIAEHFKIGLTSVYNILEEHNIPKKYNKGGFTSRSKINLDELIYLKKLGYTTAYLAKYFNVAKSSIKRYVNRHKDIIFPRVSDTPPSHVGGEDVL